MARFSSLVNKQVGGRGARGGQGGQGEQVIAAEGEQKASRALKEASDVMDQSSVALQLRYLQVRAGRMVHNWLSWTEGV